MADGTAQPKLSGKQEAWIAAYLGPAKGNATEAARIAGYSKARQSGSENLSNPVISARVSQHVEQKFATSDQVLQKLTEIALADPFEFVEVLSRDQSGRPLRVKMDLSNQVKALELLGKYHQLFVDKQQIDVNIREHFRTVPKSTLDAMFQPAERLDA